MQICHLNDIINILFAYIRVIECKLGLISKQKRIKLYTESTLLLSEHLPKCKFSGKFWYFAHLEVINKVRSLLTSLLDSP